MRDAAENGRSHPRDTSYDRRDAACYPAQATEELVAVLRPERIGHLVFEFLEAFAFLEFLFLRPQEASDGAAHRSQEAVSFLEAFALLEFLGGLHLLELLGGVHLLEAFFLLEAFGRALGLIETELLVHLFWQHGHRTSPLRGSGTTSTRCPSPTTQQRAHRCL